MGRDSMVDIIWHAKQERGVKLSSVHAQSVVSSNSEFVELVLGPGSPLIGEYVERGAELVESHYKAGLMAMRRLAGGCGGLEAQVSCGSNGLSPTGARRLARGSTFVAGDVLLVLTPLDQSFPKSDFLLVTRIAALP